MWPKLRARQGVNMNELNDAQKNTNFHEEYQCALRTRSYADFYNKTHQLLAKQPSIYSNNNNKLSGILLEPDQETIHSILDTLTKKPKVKNLMLSYFDISAEASHICTHILKIINQVNSNQDFIQRAIEIMDDENCPQENLNSITIELNSFISTSTNPFSSLVKGEDFKIISEKHSSMLQLLNSKRKRVGRKIKFIKRMEKTSGICVTAAYGLVAITTIIIATHTLTPLMMGPAIITFPCKSLIKKLQKLKFFSRIGFLRKVFDQIDMAAKGTYILNRDIDTMNSLVARIYDEIEHNRAMVKFCLERKGEKVSLEIVKELKRSDYGFRKQVEELEEQVCLCLVTINRTRGLVIEEMTKSCA